MNRAQTKLTPPQIARMLGVSRDQVLAWIHSGDLPAINGSSTDNGRHNYLVVAKELKAFERRISSLPSETHSQDSPSRQHADPPRWLSVEQIRKQQRMRRETVIAAMLSGELPYEQRGRIRYARVSDVEAWEQARLTSNKERKKLQLHSDLADFL